MNVWHFAEVDVIVALLSKPLSLILFDNDIDTYVIFYAFRIWGLDIFDHPFCGIYIFFLTNWPGSLAYSESRILLILLAFRRLNVAPDFDQ